MSVLVLCTLLCLILTVWSHGTERNVGDVPDHIRFRILKDEDVPAELAKTNMTASNRRLSIDYWSRLKDEVTHEKLHGLAHKHVASYAVAKPFPHLAISEIIPQDILDAIHLEIPDNPNNDGNGCVLGGDCYNSKVNEDSKSAWFDMNKFGPATQAAFTFLKSPAFVKFLEKLTGIEEIMPDGELSGAGIHQTLSKGRLGVHADFNVDRAKHIHRRVNVFLYLNPDWKDEYGGHLELWSRDLQRCEARISPDLGKLVIFSSTDFSYHGHQSRMTCPPDRSRRSLAMYYYTKTRPAHECLDNNCDGQYHSTLWQTTLCPSCHDDQKCYAPTA